AGRLDLDLAALAAGDGPLAVDGNAERVDHAPNHPLPDWHVGDAAGALDDVALAQLLVLAHQRHADGVFLEVEDQAHEVVGELDQLAGHHALEAVDTGDAVPGGEDGAGLAHLDLLAISLDLLAEDAA